MTTSSAELTTSPSRINVSFSNSSSSSSNKDSSVQDVYKTTTANSSSFSSSTKSLVSKRDGCSRKIDRRAGSSEKLTEPLASHLSNPPKYGYGNVTYANGDQYVGYFLNGLRSGPGRVYFANGNACKGIFCKNRMRGRGTLKFASGNKYQGDFVDGLMSGRGTFTWSNGDEYKGDFLDGKRTGRGTITWADGEVYEGDFVDGKRTGRGKFTDHYGICLEGIFQKGHFQGEISNLGDLAFLQLLCGIPMPEGINHEYALSIMSDFLIVNGYTELGEALKSANKTYQNGKKSLDDVHGKIKNKHTQLLVYGCSYHATGLNINCNPNSDNALFEIFNSDPELSEGHEKNGSKYNTMLVEEIPIKNITRKQLRKILDCGSFEDMDSAYRAIKSIPGAKTIFTKDLPSPVWQTPQKKDANNCTIEWINAFLRNKMSKEEYDGMRLKLFEVCLDQAKKKVNSPEYDHCIGILEKKREKRMKRLKESTVKLANQKGKSRYITVLQPCKRIGDRRPVFIYSLNKKHRALKTRCYRITPNIKP